MSNAAKSRLPSDRKFGLTFTILLAAVGAWAAFRNWGWAWCVTGLIASGAAGVITFTAPTMLSPLNRGWFYAGETMGKLVSPVVLAVIFFGVLTPIAIVTRLFGRDELRLRRRMDATYWIRREPPGAMAESFKNQF